MSQPGLSKQVRDHQHSSEVFSFLFTEEIYIGHIDLKKRKASARVTKNKQTGSPSSIQIDLSFLIHILVDNTFTGNSTDNKS